MEEKEKLLSEILKEEKNNLYKLFLKKYAFIIGGIILGATYEVIIQGVEGNDFKLLMKLEDINPIIYISLLIILMLIFDWYYSKDINNKIKKAENLEGKK